ncbi:MAG: ADP-ribosylglycohydrolase family protein, partial [Actinomycetota bacterium]
GVTARAYLRWLKTQSERPRHLEELTDEEQGWLFQQPDLHHRRAPGNTCVSALKAMELLGDSPARNNSKGCGAVMRMAPAGLFVASVGRGVDADAAFELGTDLSAITHGHPTGSLAGGAFAVLILELARGSTLSEAIMTAKSSLIERPHHEETHQALESARLLADQGVDHPSAIRQLGEGWVVDEALAISVYCALVADDFKHGVMLAVNHDGDSDSTGSITGNLLGVAHGVDAIPAEWLNELELREVIEEVADDLCDFPGWQISDYDSEEGGLTDRVWRKYPGC